MDKAVDEVAGKAASKGRGRGDTKSTSWQLRLTNSISEAFKYSVFAMIIHNIILIFECRAFIVDYSWEEMNGN